MTDRDDSEVDTDSGGSMGGSSESLSPSDAFALLGNGTRMAILRALYEATRTDETPVSFSTLYEATDESTTAGFAYHLRQLVGSYVRKDGDAGYALTYAGSQVARALAAGTYTESVSRPPVAIADPCPLCEETGLEARGEDNVVTVACTACERDVLSLPFPPGGHRSHDDDLLPSAFDRYHRHRIAHMADGACPECGGAVEAAVEPVASGDASVVEAALTCRSCGYQLRCPVTLAVRDHPAVVSLYHEAGEDMRERPVWNVGSEWRERVISTDPLAVRVSTQVGETVLSLYVGRDLTVVFTEEERRKPVSGADPAPA
jgi:DNA-binding transcriptional ArsR family regulator